MYVLIDRQQMAITHKHHDRAVLAKLSWIECTNAGATFPLTSARNFAQEFTPLELKLIYKNATGADLQGFSGCAQAVFEAAKRMPESVVNAEEVFAQAACIMDGDKSCYQYAPGQKTPIIHTGLFVPDAIQIPRVEAEELLARASTSYAPAHGTGVTTGEPGTATAQRAPSAPRQGGNREIIYKVADDMWAAAGSPTNVAVVLNLRKQMMVELEANHGIKKTTSSTALGDWMKARLG